MKAKRFKQQNKSQQEQRSVQLDGGRGAGHGGEGLKVLLMLSFSLWAMLYND